MSWIRLSLRLPAFVLFLAGTAGLVLILQMAVVISRRPRDRRWSCYCFRGAVRCLGLRIHYHGTPPREPALYVSNHISWCDIPVIGARAPLHFLAKSEVARWPLIGWLARQDGTLFIRRGAGQARQVRADMAQLLARGESVLFFPEGTSGTGTTVLPFHGLLLQAAQQARVPIQPVTISYRRDGQPDTLAPFVGDDTFLRHLFSLLGQPSPRVDVLFHSPLASTGHTDSRLAAELHTIILAGLRQIHGYEADGQPQPDFNTEDTPGRFPHPSLAAGQQFPDQNKG